MLFIPFDSLVYFKFYYFSAKTPDFLPNKPSAKEEGSSKSKFICLINTLHVFFMQMGKLLAEILFSRKVLQNSTNTQNC